jgi:hypothetical protein
MDAKAGQGPDRQRIKPHGQQVRKAESQDRAPFNAAIALISEQPSLIVRSIHLGMFRR